MRFDLTPELGALQQRSRGFIAEQIIPLENDPGRLATTAVPDGDHGVIDGLTLQACRPRTEAAHAAHR